MRGWSHWNRLAILHNLNIIHAGKNRPEKWSRNLSKTLSWYRSQNHRSVPPPYYIKFQFDTFRTSDETRFCHTRSAVKFYTQYTKETRTKTGNVSELYIHIWMCCRPRMDVWVVPLEQSCNSTQPQYYTCWRNLIEKLITSFIENSIVISNEFSQICTPPYYIEFHFDTFSTSDKYDFCHTRSALQFCTQYTKETRTKTGNVSKLYIHIWTCFRPRMDAWVVPLHPSHDSTQPQYYTCWQNLIGKLVATLIEKSIEISNEQSQSCTPSMSTRCQFHTFRTSDETHSCHTRSAVKFYTRYTKETRTKTGNVSELLHPISTPSRPC